MTEDGNLEKSLSFYSERSSANAEQELETIFANPEINLTDEELQEARKLAEGLFAGELPSGLKSGSAKTLEQIYQFSATEGVQEFYVEYFFTEDGQKDLAMLGIKANKAADITQALCDIDRIKNKVDAKTRKKIAANSRDWDKSELAARLEQDPQGDSSYQDRNSLFINYEPEKLIENLEDLRAYKRFFWEARGELKKEERSNVHQAKTTLLDLYTARVNNMIATEYSEAISLGKQLAQKDDDDSLKKRFEAAMPMVQRAVSRNRARKVSQIANYAQEMSRRIDFLKYGVAWAGDQLSSISPEVIDLAEELDAEGEPGPDIRPAAVLPPETVARLDGITWQAEDLKAFAEEVVGSWGVLSTETTDWSEADERNGFAEDGKWQIIISPKKQNMAVDPSKRVFFIPEKYSRTLTQRSPAGGLPGLAHELTHLVQSHYDHELGEQLPLAKIKGRRSVTLREAGAVDQEQNVFEMLGRPRTTDTHYFKALRTKLAGGNKMQTVRAFYDSFVDGRNLDSQQLTKARELAADRAMRFYRVGGYNSQPLDYIEQELITRALNKIAPEKAQVLKLCGTSFSIAEMAKLRKVGLVNLPDGASFLPADSVMGVFSQNS